MGSVSWGGRRRLVLACLSAVLVGACGGSTEEAPPVAQRPVEPVVLARPVPPQDGSLALAAIFPAAGRYAASGLQSMEGARLAVADLNRAGGIRGRSVFLLEYPIGSYFLDARRAAEMAADAGALAIVGSNSSDLSMAIAEEAEAAHLVQISNVSTAEDLTWDPATGRDRRFVFRVCASDVTLGERLATFARETLGARRAAVLYEVGRAYSTRLARAFVTRFGVTRDEPGVAEFVYLAQETDFRLQLRQVRAFAPDVLFLPGSFADVTLIARQAKALGLDASLLGADAWSNPLLFKRGGPRRPAYYVDHCGPAFDQRFLQAVGQPTQGCRAALAYDAVQSAAAGLEALGKLRDGDLASGLPATRRRLRDAVAAAVTPGVTGRIRFDGVGDRVIAPAVMVVERGAGDTYEARLFTGARP
jgi:branched-chain amino acid transport system substrate-binding protein